MDGVERMVQSTMELDQSYIEEGGGRARNDNDSRACMEGPTMVSPIAMHVSRSSISLAQTGVSVPPGTHGERSSDGGDAVERYRDLACLRQRCRSEGFSEDVIEGIIRGNVRLGSHSAIANTFAGATNGVWIPWAQND